MGAARAGDQRRALLPAHDGLVRMLARYDPRGERAAGARARAVRARLGEVGSFLHLPEGAAQR